MKTSTKAKIDNIGATFIVLLALTFVIFGLVAFVCSIELTTVDADRYGCY